MDNPEYTERQINEALKALTDRNITIGWDGYEPSMTEEEPASFDVYLNDDATGLLVWDQNGSFDIVERTGVCFYATLDWAVRYDEVARKLVEIIEEGIAAHKFSEGDDE